MKMYKSAGNFAKVGEDIVDKDILTIEKDGEEIAGKYGAQIVFGIGTKNGSKVSGVFCRKSQDAFSYGCTVSQLINYHALSCTFLSSH